MDELKRLIVRWIENDDKISTLRCEMDELDDVQDEITTDLLDHVEEHGMVGKRVNIPGGFIEFKNQSRSASLTQKIVIAALKSHEIDSVAVMETIRGLKAQEKREHIYVVRHDSVSRDSVSRENDVDDE
jgi:hypothetical protein